MDMGDHNAIGDASATPLHPGPSVITGTIVPDAAGGARRYTLRVAGILLGDDPDLAACYAAMRAAAAEQRASLGGRVRGRTVTITIEDRIGED